MGTRSVGLAMRGLLALVALGCLLAVAGPASAATASELLQKAIYTEETVGNLEEAMKLYEQVIAEGKTAQDAAAQAQFRLALCYQKKGQDAEARAAFEAVIKNFPNAKELVAQARKHLPSDWKLLPTPWTPGERLQLNMKLPSGLPIGTMIYMVDVSQNDDAKHDVAKDDGKDLTRCSTRGLVTVNGASSFSEVLCQTESFAPIESLWKHSMLGEAKAVYGENSATITVVGKDKTFTLDFTPPAFDNEQCFQMLRRLPLTEDFKTTVNVVTTLGGSVIDLPVKVTKVETITVPAGSFECFRLELAIVNQTFWISNDEHRYVVRFAAGGVSADLVKIWQAEAGRGETVDGKGFSLALPVGWLAYDESNPDEPNEVSIQLLDPRANARCEVAVRPKSELTGEKASSTKAWTESFIDDVKKTYGDFAVNDQGLVEIQVGGHSATEIVADYTEGAKQLRTLGIAVIGEKSAATMRFTTEASKFDAERGAFDEIVKNFKID